MPSDRNLLVLYVTGQRSVKEGEQVVVSGILRPYSVANIQHEYGSVLNASLLGRLKAEYANQPVLVARTVLPLATPVAK